MRKKKKVTLRFDATTAHGGIRGPQMSCALIRLGDTSNLETLGNETDINVHTEDGEAGP